MSASCVQEETPDLNSFSASTSREIVHISGRNGHPPLVVSEPPSSRQRPVEFAHPSEAEFARILDFYQVAWQYEPRTFAVEWDEEGNFVSSFTPDFYLPDHDLYIELTTLKQKLVTAKNRKVRLLRRHYPNVRIKLFYGADYRKLLAKFAACGAWQEPEAGEEFTQI